MFKLTEDGLVLTKEKEVSLFKENVWGDQSDFSFFKGYDLSVIEGSEKSKEVLSSSKALEGFLQATFDRNGNFKEPNKIDLKGTKDFLSVISELLYFLGIKTSLEEKKLSIVDIKVFKKRIGSVYYSKELNNIN